jgi:cephalosporin hydroxylase
MDQKVVTINGVPIPPTSSRPNAIQIPNEMAMLAEFLKELKPHNVMEIGCEDGGMFHLLCTMASGIKISLDDPYGETGSGKYRNFNELMARKTLMRTWASNVEVLTGDSHSTAIEMAVGILLLGQSLDFLFIDGDHTFEGVTQDYRMYGHYVKPGGWIGFHDIEDTEYHQRLGCDVARLWKALEGEKRELSVHSYWGGIGLLHKAVN